MSQPHIPVLLDEVIAALDPKPGDVIVDATFGAGGYTRAILDKGAQVHAFDRDPDAIANGAAMVAEYEDRLTLHPHRFSQMVAALRDAGVACVDGVVMDIGVSSMQLDQAERGFAFSHDGPLDMRMSQTGESAADFLNTADADQIAAARPLETTGDLARVVRKALGHKPHDKKDPATRSFQAVRIHVNGELDELEQGLAAAETLLGEGGRLAVVSFHSLEDRIVKRFLRDASSAPAASRHLPQVDSFEPAFTRVSKAIRPGEAEIARNPRARSSVLRHAVRSATPAREAA